MCHEILEVEHRMQLETENRLPVKSLDVNTLRALTSQGIIAGLSTNVFFVNHNLADTESNQETATCASQFEAEFLLGLCKYLVQQGYEQQAIAIVTLCPRQVFVILALLRMEAYFDIRVVTIENYINEENDIILLTVASHNVNRHDFFVNNDDQVSMVLSNAGKGLYCCGNFGYLSKNSQFYQNLTSNLESCGRIGFNLEIVCQNHPNIKRYVACRDDFRRLSPRGGCLQICGVRQPCGHHCQQVCHLDGHSDCTDVMKVLPSCGHSMLLPCLQDVSVANCVTKVEHVLKKCRHKVSLECYIDARFYKCRVKVKHVFLLCQHEIDVECSANPNVILCEEACDYRLDCGHRCPRVCHLLDDPDHVDVLCTNPCPKIVCERKHRCQSRCCEPCSTCSVIVGKELLCGHRAMVPCHQDVTNAAVSCGKLCKRILRCGHLCQRACSDPCGKCDVKVEKLLPNCGHTITVRCMFSTEFIKCTKGCTLLLSCGHACTNKCSDPCSQQCNQLVSCTFKPCGHIGTVPCHDRTSSQTNAVFCQALCGRLLPCEHQCKGRCGECRQGRVHTPCRETCGRNLICGHQCETPCSQACMPCKRICENRCTHSRCPKKCGQPCKPCWEPCPWQCPHFQCGKYCNEFCTRPRCDEPCSLLLRCGHLCIGLCGETCPTLCRVCNKAELTEFMLYGNEEDDNAHFIQLEDCGHCIEVEALDHWMDMNADEIQMKGCPRCKTTIWRSLRYGNVIRQRLLDVQKVKKLLFGSKSKLGDTVNYLQDVLTFKDTIQVDFPEEILHLQLCLTQKTTFHQNELVLMENQINMLELMTKMKQKTKMMTPEVKNDFIIDMKRLAQRLMQNEEHITEYELGQINCEIRRMFLVAAAADTEKKLAHQINAQCAEHLARAKHILDQGTVFTSTEEKEIEVALETALQLRGGLGISDQERVAIVRAMGFSPGHWYKCPNGHVYAIAGCGGAMQISKCNECGARIGGQNRALLTGNAHAGEMDGSPQAAWPEAP